MVRQQFRVANQCFDEVVGLATVPNVLVAGSERKQRHDGEFDTRPTHFVDLVELVDQLVHIATDNRESVALDDALSVTAEVHDGHGVGSDGGTHAGVFGEGLGEPSLSGVKESGLALVDVPPPA